jgi:membrane-bound lytic murein transglycosylase MltF
VRYRYRTAVKVRFFLLSLTLAMGAACGSQAPERAAAPPPDAAPPPAAAPAPPPDEASPEDLKALEAGAPVSDAAVAKALSPWSGDLDGMVTRRYIRMLVTFSKTNYFIDLGEQHGATYEAGRAFEEFVNGRLKTGTIRVHVIYIPVRRERIFQALAEGRGDIAAANLTITPDRQRIADFATPFLNDVRELVVTAAGQPPVASAEDLSGREVHVRRSSSYYESLVALNASLKAGGRAPVKIVEANEQLEDEDILELVNAGVIPITVVDNHTAELWARIFEGIAVQSGAAVRTGGQIGWALRRGTPQLREMVDAFAAVSQKGSLAFNLVYQKYFKNTKWIRNAASESERRKFEQMVAFFRKYGDQYDFPYLLVAAQAYQESQIDQTKRSSAGAVGVMQIKPSTAADNPINITGVDKSAEKNIHAGVKYLRFIADRYFSDEPMDQVTKGLFAVASYNAGPARVAGLRKKARGMGLDPNKWFGNVEIVAAREIGRETVTYVSNIYKYYVTFRLMSEQVEARRKAKGG